MSRVIYQNQPFKIRFQAMLSGSPVTGLTSVSVGLAMVKHDEDSFVTSVYTGFQELGNGFYSLTVDQAKASSIGELIARVYGAGFDDVYMSMDVMPSPIGVSPSLSTCLIIGNIVDLGGLPSSNSGPIVFRGVDNPLVAGVSLLSTNKVETFPNANGDFSVALLRGQKVEVRGAKVSLKLQFTVPDQASANIVDLIP